MRLRIVAVCATTVAASAWRRLGILGRAVSYERRKTTHALRVMTFAREHEDQARANGDDLRAEQWNDIIDQLIDRARTFPDSPQQTLHQARVHPGFGPGLFSKKFLK